MLLNISDEAWQSYKAASADMTKVWEGFHDETLSPDDFERGQETWDTAVEEFLAVVDTADVTIMGEEDLSTYGTGSAFIDTTGTVWRMEVQSYFGEPPKVLWRSFNPNGSTTYGGSPTLPLTPIFVTTREATV